MLIILSKLCIQMKVFVEGELSKRFSEESLESVAFDRMQPLKANFFTKSLADIFDFAVIFRLM